MKSFAALLMFVSLLVSGCSSAPKIGPQEHFKRGNQLFQQNLCQDAITEYKQAIALDDQNAAFHYNMGLCYYQLSIWDKAIEAYHQAIKLQPNLGEAWYNLSLVYNKTDNTEQAFLAYERYQKIMRGEVVAMPPKLKKQPAGQKPKPKVLYGPNSGQNQGQKPK